MTSRKRKTPQQKLVNARRTYERLEKQLDAARLVRRDFISQAARTGVPKTEIAQHAGVTRQYVYDILKEEA